MKPMIFGGDGNLGIAVSNHLDRLGMSYARTTIEKHKPSNDNNWLHFDLTDNVDDWVIPEGFDVAFMFSAITSLKTCEQDPVGTRKINVENAIKLLDRLHNKKIFIIYPSSNQVFNGEKPYVTANDETSPITEYGRHKADIENYLLNLDNAAVIRLTKVISPELPLFCNWIDQLKNKQTIYPFHDMVFSPISLSLVLEVMMLVATQKISGIIQVSGEKDITYHQAASYIANCIGADSSLVNPISALEKGIARNMIPSHTTMDMSRLVDEFGINPPSYEAVIDKFLLKRNCKDSFE